MRLPKFLETKQTESIQLLDLWTSPQERTFIYLVIKCLLCIKWAEWESVPPRTLKIMEWIDPENSWCRSCLKTGLFWFFACTGCASGETRKRVVTATHLRLARQLQWEVPQNTVSHRRKNGFWPGWLFLIHHKWACAAISGCHQKNWENPPYLRVLTQKRQIRKFLSWKLSQI